MADLVTSESRRYLHGIQKETNDTTELPYTVQVGNQVTYIDSFTTYGEDTIYGKEYVIAASSGRADASGITNTPTGNIAATTVQAAINELDSEKGGLAQDNTWAGSNTFTQALTALQFVKSGGTSSQFLKADGSVDSSSYESTITAGTTSQYYRGDKTWQTLDTAAVTESTNLYFTNARVLGTVLTGLNTSLTGAVVDSDTILAAIGKLENRVAGFSAAGVSSFNTRTGDVTLTSGDVTGALGFSPSPDTHTHPASSITNTPVAPITSTNVQGALNEVASLANSASSAATNAQTAANNAASAAAYADRIARQSDNLIKNGNSEDPNPTGWEAAWISDSGAYTGTRCRALTVAVAGGNSRTTVGEAPCDPGDQFVFSAWGKQAAASNKQYIYIEFLNAAGARTGLNTKAFPASTAYTQAEVSGEAPAGTVKARFVIYLGQVDATTYYWDNLYATRKVSAGMLEADILKAMLIKGEVIESPNYVTGSAGVAPVGVKIAGAPFPATLRNGSTLQVNMELGTGASVGGESVQAILDASVYADTLLRSNNLIKNGNSEDPNPTGYEAAWISDSGAYTGTRCRALTVAVASYGSLTVVGEAPCVPGDQFVFSAWGKQAAASSGQRIEIEFLDAAGYTTGTTFAAFPASTVYTQAVVFGKAPAGTVKVRFRLIAFQPQYATTYYWDCLYAELKFPAVVLAEDAVQSTTHTFTVSNATESTSTTTGAIVATGGIATSNYFTGRYRSQDGSSGITVTKTFYAASSSGGSATVLNTVVVKDGIITSWT